MKKPSKKQIEARNAEVEALSAQVEEGVKAISSEPEWREWLRAIGTFHNYSWTNLLLIRLQMPSATRCAGYRTWQKLDRQVRKGEKGLRIFAPMIVKDDTAPDGRRLIGFKPTSTFDVSQTDGEPLPEKPARDGLLDDLDAALDAEARLMWTAAKLDKHLPPVSPTQDPTERAYHLAVALAERVGPQNTGALRAKVEAEAVAYVVLSMLDIDVETETFPRLVELTKGSHEEISRVAESVRKTSHKILAALEDEGEEIAEAA